MDKYYADMIARLLVLERVFPQLPKLREQRIELQRSVLGVDGMAR